MSNLKNQRTDSPLLFQVEGSVAKLTLNKPDVSNAFDAELIRLITTAITTAEQDKNVRVIVLQANGKHFSAGADLQWMKSMANENYDYNFADAKQLAHLMQTLNNCSKVTIARVQGAAYGGAIGLIACCDIVAATADARFCLSEVKLGLSPAVISPFVIEAIGARQARRYFLTAERFEAQKALELNLVHSVLVTETEVDEQIQTWCQQVSQNAPSALLATKHLIKRVSIETDTDSISDYTCNLIATLRVAEEGQEGMSAFFERRSPNWNG
ncbi:MAG: enoyl-CoA hydratase-related protein [Pseudomonadales bacterium]|nr:enoyl-CoA hydratase-related protein [Pseudomonadales bacterium]